MLCDDKGYGAGNMIYSILMRVGLGVYSYDGWALFVDREMSTKTVGGQQVDYRWYFIGIGTYVRMFVALMILAYLLDGLGV